MQMKTLAGASMVLGSLLLLSACATQIAAPEAGHDVPGFFLGLFHGFVAPWSLLLGIFTDVRVFAFPNSGWWYDLGFCLGIGVFSAGGTSCVK